MYTVANDLELGLQIGRFSGPTNTDADYERYLQGIIDFDAHCVGRNTAIVLVVEAGNPPPHSSWRRRIAEGTAVLLSSPKFALVTDSLIIRGVLIAINWVRPPTYEFATKATFDLAIDWMVARRSIPLSRFRELLAEVNGRQAA